MLGTQLPSDMFRFTVGDRAPVYTAVLHAFGQANERLETSLALGDLAARLQQLGWAGILTEAELFDVLKQLREWRLLDVTQNHAGNYRTADEYERRNLQYSLTRNGEAALAGIEHAAAVLASTGALQTAVLDAVADRLAELGRLLADPASDDRRGVRRPPGARGPPRRPPHQHHAVQRPTAAPPACRGSRPCHLP